MAEAVVAVVVRTEANKLEETPQALASQVQDGACQGIVRTKAG